MLAYHFVGETLRDGRPIPPDGEWLEHTGPLVLCESGLHASRNPFDALRYAPGATLCLVEVDGEIIEADDKLVARRRRIIARRDATTMLRKFACKQALSVAHLWAMPEIVRQYLTTQDENLRAAKAAAEAAAKAAEAAAEAAAKAAAWAAEAAAKVATANAAEAAKAAAEAAAWAATWAADEFTQRVALLFADVPEAMA